MYGSTNINNYLNRLIPEAYRSDTKDTKKMKKERRKGGKSLTVYRGLTDQPNKGRNAEEPKDT